ncbi:hypothetical protein [Lactococcus termiticola]|uniref:hypothetical protein n=1 Tax=Lactococcus termiticola TaxID=2169526 RepID=UPI000D64E774|nr:hypothetical protein [Lactococcus termiticola]
MFVGCLQGFVQSWEQFILIGNLGFVAEMSPFDLFVVLSIVLQLLFDLVMVLWLDSHQKDHLLHYFEEQLDLFVVVVGARHKLESMD